MELFVWAVIAGPLFWSVAISAPGDAEPVEASTPPAPYFAGRVEAKGLEENGGSQKTEEAVDRALDWLDGLNSSTEVVASPSQYSTAIRIYDAIELERFDAPARGYLLHLEQLGILAPPQREVVIDRLLALDSGEIDIEQIKWVVMMVLFSQPGQELAYARMEDLVFEEGAGSIH